MKHGYKYMATKQQKVQVQEADDAVTALNSTSKDRVNRQKSSFPGP
jgi:hypothetical protein